MTAPGNENSERVLERTLHEVSSIMKLCEDALRAQPLNTDAMITKAFMLARAGDRMRAMILLQMVTDIDPDYPGVWRAKAAIYRKLGQEALAELCIEIGTSMEALQDEAEDVEAAPPPAA